MVSAPPMAPSAVGREQVDWTNGDRTLPHARTRACLRTRDGLGTRRAWRRLKLWIPRMALLRGFSTGELMVHLRGKNEGLLP